jgi:hypothetical protein
MHANTANRSTTDVTSLAPTANDIAVACQRVRANARQRRTRRAARDGQLRKPLAASAGGPSTPSITTTTAATTTPTTEVPMPATTRLINASITNAPTTTTTTQENPMLATTIPTAASITTTPTKETAASPITVPPASGRRARPSFPKPGTDLYDAIEYRAEREIEWYFESPADRSRRPEATACIERWLAELPSFYRGAITLRYDTTRVWPKRVAEQLAPFTAIAVRFYGANRPVIGPAGDVEQAIAKRIDAILEADAGGTGAVFDAFDRARAFFAEAVVAFMKVRGTGKCVAPWPRRRKRVPPSPPPGPRRVTRIGRTGLLEKVPADPPSPSQPASQP